jgi:rubrerythrin
VKFQDYINELFSEVGKFQSDKEILRAAIMAELDAINFYEQLSTRAADSRIKRVLLDIAQEEKVHFGEFEELLEMIDPEHEPAESEAEEELEDMGIIPTESE